MRRPARRARGDWRARRIPRAAGPQRAGSAAGACAAARGVLHRAGHLRRRRPRRHRRAGAAASSRCPASAACPTRWSAPCASTKPSPGLWWGSRLAVHAAFRHHGRIGATLIRLAVCSAHARGCQHFPGPRAGAERAAVRAAALARAATRRCARAPARPDAGRPRALPAVPRRRRPASSPARRERRLSAAADARATRCAPAAASRTSATSPACARCAALPRCRADSVPVGDDCAAIPDGDGHLLFAIEGFVDDFVEPMPWFAGYCGVMVNVSDIYAMGGRPLAVVDALWSQRRPQARAGARRAWPRRRGATACRSSAATATTAASAASWRWRSLGRAKRLLTSFDARPGDGC